MKKNSLYWLCQIGGWIFFTVIEIVSYINVFGFNRLLLLNGFVNFVLGVTFTHLYRVLVIRSGWLNLSLSRLIPRAIIGLIIISSFVTFINVWLDRLTVPLVNNLPIDIPLVLEYFFNLSRYILLWALIYHMFQYWERSLKSERDRFQMEAMLKDIQYNNLKTQLNPHFLFNSLNSIRTLIDMNPAMAKEAITRLSNLLRSSLQMNKQKTVPLREDLETVKDYLAIEKIRFDNRLQFEFEIDPATLDLQLPPMMLQTLVENGVKHGVSQLKQGGFIRLESQRNNGYMEITISNSGQFQKHNGQQGLGLENTRERLQLLYDDRAIFEIGNSTENEVTTKLKIPV